jgi:hypothetical protein
MDHSLMQDVSTVSESELSSLSFEDRHFRLLFPGFEVLCWNF